jgi:hypothetical protein
MNFITQYKNPLFNAQCQSYAAVAYTFIKSEFKRLKMKNYFIKMKSYSLGEDGLHYYIEIKIGSKTKWIIDNDSCVYAYNEYKNKFKPKQIKIIKVSDIDWMHRETRLFENDLYNCILLDIVNIISEPLTNVLIEINKTQNENI